MKINTLTITHLYIIIQTNSVFNTFRGFRFTGGQNIRFPIDFVVHR